MRRITLWYLLTTSAAAVSYFILPTTPLSKLLLYNGIGLVAVIATLIGIRHKRVRDPAGMDADRRRTDLVPRW